MNKLKSFNENRYHYLIESVHSIDIQNLEKVLENFDYDKYLRTSNKIQKKLGVELYYIKNFSLSISSLYPLIEKLISIGDFNFEKSITNTILITMCVVNVLSKESKEVVEKLFEFANENNITQDDLDIFINIMNNIEKVFIDICKKMNKNITNFISMVSYIELFVPFNTALLSLLNQEKITIETLINLFNSEDKIKYDLLIYRVIHRLNILIDKTDKFQNRENIKPLLVNWEFKSPELKPDKINLD